MCRSTRIAAVLVLLAAAAVTGCRSEASGDAAGTGMLTGYEVGNQQDYSDTRQERPDYRPFD
jgi:hypothetical protein